MIARLLAVALVLASLPYQLHATGCGLIGYEGRAGERVFLDAQQSRKFSVDVTTAETHIEPSLRGAIPAKAGTGARAWAVLRMPEGTAVSVIERLPSSALKEAGTIDLSIVPFTFSWTEDAAGAPWLFFDTIREGRRAVAAYRLTAEGWKPEGVGHGELRVPRLDRARDRIHVGSQLFAAGAAPQRVKDPEGKLSDRFDYFPLPDGSLFATESTRGAWLLPAAGSKWQPVAMPWRGQRRAFPSMVHADTVWPTVAWQSDDDAFLHVAQWRDGNWEWVASLEKEKAIDGGGPLILVGGRAILFGGCYYFDEREWFAMTSFDRDTTTTTRVLVER